MRTSAPIRAGAALLVAAASSTVTSGQTITDGNSTFLLPDANTTGASVRTGTTGGTGANFIAGGDTTDQLFQQWWWYRVDPVNPREFALSGRTSSVAAGNTHTLEFTEPEGFNARLVYKITDGADSPATANVASTLTIFNTSPAPLTIAVYCYLDYDLEGVATDSAALVSPGRIQITDQTTGFNGQLLGVGANSFQVASFATVRTNLSDADIDNFADTGLPFAAADFTGALQWNLTIPAGANRTVRAAISLNSTAANSGCAADFNDDNTVSVQDIFDFLVAYFANLPTADINGVDGVTIQDIFDFLVLYFTGCP